MAPSSEPFEGTAPSLAATIERSVGGCPLAVVVVDRDGRVRLWNDGARAMFGGRSADVLERRLDHLGLDDAGDVAHAFAVARRDGEPRLVDLYGRHADGRASTARLAVAPCRDAGGGIIGAVGLALDLTARAESERQLAELTAEVSAQAGILHAIIDHVPADLHLLDADGRFVFVGPGNAAGFAFDPARLLGRPTNELPAPPGFTLQLERLRRRVIGSGVADRTEIEVTVGADRRTLELDLRPVRGSGGAATGTLVCIRDVSSRRAQEAALEQAYTRQSQLIANTPLGVIEWDGDRRIRRWSSQAEIIFGWAAQEVMGRRLDDLRLVHPDDLRRIALANAALMDSSLHHSVVEQRNLTQTREERFCRWYNSIVRSGDGEDLTVLSLVEDLTEQEATRRQIRALAEHDHLTGLLNRTLFRDRLEQALARTRRLRSSGALVLVDLDQFKGINDTYGHAAGDGVLTDVARKLTSSVRESDTVARLGGDEFALIIPDLGAPEVAAEVTQKILDLLATPYRIEGEEVTIGASMGIALFPEDGSEADDLFNKADIALYRSKASGRRRCVFYRPGMNRRVETRRQLAHELHDAIENGALELHYQPQFASPHGALIGAEATLRWQHPSRGLLTPAGFLDVAERTGAIRRIGPMLVEESCRQARAWLDLRRAAPFRVSLNLARSEWLRSGLAELIAARVNAFGLPADAIGIDLTEPVLGEFAAAGSPLAALAEQGVAIALDSFGGASSCLDPLVLPGIRRIKLAPELLESALRDPARRAMLETVIDLAHRLGKEVVATGIEHLAARRLAEECGCDTVQGVLLAAPMPASELTALLAEPV